MSARVATLPPRALGALCAAAVLLLALVLWFLAVSPKRAETGRLQESLAAAELRLLEAQLAASRPQESSLKVADVLRLAKAMPASSEQPGLVLELSLLARASGVTLRSLTSQAAQAQAGGATTVPVIVVVDGTFGQITRFLHRMRLLVTVRGGKLRATGRLLTVQSVDLVESVASRFPRLDATISLDAFVYDGPIAPATPSRDGGDELSTESSAAGGTS